MSRISKVGKIVEYGIYVALTTFCIKIAFSILVGYIYTSPKYAGPVFFRWRKDYVDPSLAKDSYSFINPNSEDDTELFKMFRSYVQPIHDPKAYKNKIKRLQKNLDEATEANKNVEECQNILDDYVNTYKPKTLITEINTTPLYFVEQFTDGFEIKPSKTFKIFNIKKKNDTNEFNKAALVADISFLSFRCVFLTYLSAKKPGFKNYTSISKKEVDNFFNNISTFKFDKTEDNLYRLSTICDVNLTTPIIFDQLQYDGFIAYTNAIPEIRKLFDLIGAQNLSSICTIDGNEVKASDDFKNIVSNIVDLLNLKDLFDVEGMKFEEVLNAFLTRFCLLKPTAYDVRILNRLYYMYLYMHSYYEPATNGPKIDSKYNEFKNKVDLALADLNDVNKNLSKDMKDELTIKVGLFTEKMTKRRVELIFNILSRDIATGLGSLGNILKKADDDRNFFLKLLNVYSKLYTEDDNENGILDIEGIIMIVE